MISMGVGQIQKNISILTTLTEAIRIVDKRRNKTVAIVYPASSSLVPNVLVGNAY